MKPVLAPTMIQLSLIIPCFNEAKNLPLLIARIRETFDRADVEVILVDNGSTDNTPAILTEQLTGQKHIRSVCVERNEGYGSGILAGLEAAHGKILGWTHADMQTDPADALRGLALFEAAPDPERLFVKGRRRGRPLADILFTVGMSFFETVLLGRMLWDINAQPTMFSRSFIADWKDPPHDFSLDLYTYYQARRERLVVSRFSVNFGERAYGTSHWNVDWRAKLRFIRRTLEFSVKLRKRLRSKA